MIVKYWIRLCTMPDDGILILFGALLAAWGEKATIVTAAVRTHLSGIKQTW
jgi:hypothetical protein